MGPPTSGAALVAAPAHGQMSCADNERQSRRGGAMGAARRRAWRRPPPKLTWPQMARDEPQLFLLRAPAAGRPPGAPKIWSPARALSVETAPPDAPPNIVIWRQCFLHFY